MISAMILCRVVAAQTPGKFPVVPILGSEVRSLVSKDTGRSYDLYIHPVSSQTAGKKYPVVYMLDGQWDFKLVDSVYGGLHYDKFVPEMVLVGITYSGEKPDYDSLRAMDYTPSAVKDVAGSGDAAKFLSFIKKDVVPLVEKEYNGDPANRVLMGSSYGGLFTLYAMFAEPTFFSRYIAASPAVSYEFGYSFRQETAYAADHKELPVKLFVSVGSVEGLTEPVKAFIKTLNSRSYTGLKMESRVIEGERHAGNKPEAYNRALRFLFSD